MSKSSKLLGCWCIFCGQTVPQQYLDMHLGAHGVVILAHGPIIYSDRRQGYRNGNGVPPEPLCQAITASQERPAQAALWETAP